MSSLTLTPRYVLSSGASMKGEILAPERAQEMTKMQRGPNYSRLGLCFSTSELSIFWI